MATLSVVVPTHNGSQRIPPLLRALLGQSLEPSRMEVLIVDNGSTDGSAERINASPALDELARRVPARVLALDRAGLTGARIAGVRAATGDVVLFLDDDAEPDAACCEEALRPFDEPRVGVAFGRVYPKYAREPHYAFRKREGILAINFQLGDAPVTWNNPRDFAPTLGVALAVRRTAFLEAYPWNEPGRILGDRSGGRMTSGGDVEIGQYLGAAGWWRMYNPRMVVRHAIDPGRLTVRRFIRLIAGIERSRATFEEKFGLGPPRWRRRLKAAGEAAAILALTPVLMLTRDGYRGWAFALASRAARFAGPFNGSAARRPGVPRLRDQMTASSRFRYVFWRAFGARTTFTAQLRGGLTLMLRPPPAGDLDNAYEVFVNRYYEPPPAGATQTVTTVCDVGAYVGYSMLFFLQRFPEARVTAIEPFAEHQRQLERHVRLNACEARVRLVRAAAGARERPAHLQGRGMSASIAGTATLTPGETQTHRSPDVQVVDLFSLLAGQRFDLLKVDIEGTEWECLSDPRFESLRVPLVVIEWHQAGCPERDARAACIARFERAGYLKIGEPLQDAAMGVLWFARAGE